MRCGIERERTIEFVIVKKKKKWKAIRNTTQTAVTNMTIKHMFENSFSCVCPVINNEFRHNIVKVVRNQILQGTANDKRCQRRIYKRPDQLKKCKISNTLRFLKHGSGHAMFKCLGWPCPATFIFCFRDTNHHTLVFLRPETRDVATRVSGRK